MKKPTTKRRESSPRKGGTKDLANSLNEAKKHEAAVKRLAEHTYRGTFRKFLSLVDEADNNFRMACELLEASQSDRAMERLVSAVASWVERLRLIFSEPPDTCRDVASKIIRGRLTFPINYAGDTLYAQHSCAWLNELGFQQDCLIGIPREKGDQHHEHFRKFAYEIFVTLFLLREKLILGAKLGIREPSNEFEIMVAQLPSKPGKAWKKCYLDAPAALYGKKWALEISQLESFRKSFDDLLIPLHQPKWKWPGENVRLNSKKHRAAAIADDARHRLKDFAKVMFTEKKGNS